VLGTEPYATGWSSIQSSSAQRGQELESAGGTFFCRAGPIHTTGFGFHKQSRTDRAVARGIETVKREHGNCLEIIQMRQRSFLGWRYTSLVAHARQIQKGPSFQDESDLPARLREWTNNQARPVQNPTLFRSEAVQAWKTRAGPVLRRSAPFPGRFGLSGQSIGSIFRKEHRTGRELFPPQ
jgi:hypothetical protein